MQLNKCFRAVSVLLVLMLGLTGRARTVVSLETGEPIIYASVGVINRNLGTVTDSLGNFSLNIPMTFIDDSVRISSVGYVAQTFAVRDLKSVPDTIRLADDAIALAEVVVKPGKVKRRIAGRKSGGGFITIDVENYKAVGQGLAIPMKIKKLGWMREFGFFLRVNDYTLKHMKFRLNYYIKDGGSYRLVPGLKPIYFDYDISGLDEKGQFRFVLPEEVILEKGDYYVEMEFLENFHDAIFDMPSKPMSGLTRYRYASQSEWESFPFGAPIYMEYDSLE